VELQYEPPETQRLPNEPLDFTNKTLHSAHRMYFYVRKTKKCTLFSFIDSNQLHCLRHVSKNQVFFIRKTVQAALWYFIMHLYKQSSHCQDVFDIKQILTVTRLQWLDCLYKRIIKYHKAACTIFLMKYTWLLETCRRQYRWIKSSKEKSVHFFASSFICISRCTAQNT
jgi:hypothetical protein